MYEMYACINTFEINMNMNQRKMEFCISVNLHSKYKKFRVFDKYYQLVND